MIRRAQSSVWQHIAAKRKLSSLTKLHNTVCSSTPLFVRAIIQIWQQFAAYPSYTNNITSFRLQLAATPNTMMSNWIEDDDFSILLLSPTGTTILQYLRCYYSILTTILFYFILLSIPFYFYSVLICTDFYLEH